MQRAHPREPERVHLVSAIVERTDGFLLVASRYPNRREPLWNLPGGRQRYGESLAAALERELGEETGLTLESRTLAYVSESYDRATGLHFTNVAFTVVARGTPVLPREDAHVVDLAWVARDELATRMAVAVVREPLEAYLRDRSSRYFYFDDAGITIEFADPA